MGTDRDRITLHPPGSAHAREFDKPFYEGLRGRLAEARIRAAPTLREPGAHAHDVQAGEAMIIRLPEGAQIVNLFVFNSADPDERLWVQDMALTEGVFLTRYSRLWGEMARYRPLMTMIEDSVTPIRLGPSPGGRHHFIFGGSGTPADWRYAGGPPDVLTTWEQFAAALAERGLPASLLKDNVCLFQKVGIDGPTQRFEILPSDAVTGDFVTLFAEIDVTVLLALSPYVDGSRPAHRLTGVSVRPVEVSITDRLAEPLGWPYPGYPYPDLSLYLDENGVRSAEPVPTPGLD